MIKQLPNLISAMRLLLAPIMVAVAWIQQGDWYFWLLFIALASDALDGALARALNAESALGARLDSYGDMAIYLSVPLCAMWLVPAEVSEASPFVLAVIAAYLLPIVVSLIKFQELASLHTWSAKFAGIVMGIGVLAVFAFGTTWLFKVATLVQIAVALEYLAILLILPSLKSNVKSLVHVYVAQNTKPDNDSS